VNQRRWTGEPASARFFAEAEAAVADGRWARLTLGGPRTPGPRAVVFRPVLLKGSVRLQWVEREGTSERTQQLDLREFGPRLTAGAAGFDHLTLITTTDTWTLDQRGQPRLTRTPGGASVDVAHDRTPHRALDIDQEKAWMIALGLLSPEGRPRRDGEDKVRQVQRFVELLGHAVRDLPKPAISVVDIGTGRGHLAFGAWVWLRKNGWSEARVQGVELRPHLVDEANKVAAELGFSGLSFVNGAAGVVALEGIDVIVALHACDTATDDALARGVAAGAQRLVVAPCCHREVRPQLVPPAPLGTALRHGIVREREAELLTDALRASLLGAAGYDTQIVEFVPSEHTPRNLLVMGSYNPHADRKARLAEAVGLAQFYGIRSQHLAERLGIDLRADPTNVG
jgi:hypothetical protein